MYVKQVQNSKKIDMEARVLVVLSQHLGHLGSYGLHIRVLSGYELSHNIALSLLLSR